MGGSGVPEPFGRGLSRVDASALRGRPPRRGRTVRGPVASRAGVPRLGSMRRNLPPTPETIVPATLERWGLLQNLFAGSVTTDRCQCTWFFQERGKFHGGFEGGNREALRGRVGSGPAPGLLALRGSEPVGWCAVGPRTGYSRLARSRMFRAPVDPGAWSIVCFYFLAGSRRSGRMERLIAAAVEFARANGATSIEAYPVVVPPGERTDAASGYHGFLGPFERQGFRRVRDASRWRAVVRKELAPAPTSNPSRAPGSAPDPRGGSPSVGASPRSSRGPRSTGGRPSRRSTRGTAGG